MKSNDGSFLILLLAFLFRSQLPFQFLLGRTCCKALSPNSLSSTWVSSPTTGLLAACCCIQPKSHAWCLGEVWSTASCRKHPRASSWLSQRLPFCHSSPHGVCFTIFEACSCVGKPLPKGFSLLLAEAIQKDRNIHVSLHPNRVF